MKHVLTAALIVACYVSVGHAQSLADVAKKTEEQRAKVKTPAKVYTNSDLVPDPRGARPAPGTPAPTPVADTPDLEPTTTINIITTAPVTKDEAYWKTRMRILQATLDSDQTLSTAAAVREATLNEQVHRNVDANNYIRDRRLFAEIQREWQDVVAEVSRLKAAIVNDKRAVVDLEQEARRLRVAPGWLRP